MPARQFWSTQHPVSITWRYSTDLARVDGHPMLSCTISDQESKPMASAVCDLIPGWLDDQVPSIMATQWGCYLYGEPNQLRRVTAADVRSWWEHVEMQAPSR